LKTISSFLIGLLYFLISLVTLAVLFCLPASKIKKLYARFDEKEEGWRIEALRSFVRKGETILDVGAGSGRFGKKMQEELGVKVTGVDVCDYSDGTLPFSLYDGAKLPFPDKSFDSVFFALVLHHTKNQESLMREACRVARREIIIIEDVYENPAERLFICWNDYATNILQGWIKVRKGHLFGDPFKMPMPLTFRSSKEWREFFKKFPVKIVSSEIKKSGYKPLRKITFRLEVI
jgi:ubiquinone/menaquinone biosynthesis C-methylase UbiE